MENADVCRVQRTPPSEGPAGVRAADAHHDGPRPADGHDAPQTASGPRSKRNEGIVVDEKTDGGMVRTNPRRYKELG